MPYITSVEEIGYDRGLNDGKVTGKAEGIKEGGRSLILRQLNRRIGAPNRTIDRINKLSITRLESLGEALLDFSAIDDLTTWLFAKRRVSRIAPALDPISPDFSQTEG